MTALPHDSNFTWVPDTDQFSSRLAVLRHAMGWNAKEAAMACGIAAQSWREWEDGRQPRDYSKACAKIADRTGCDRVWLMTGFVKPGMMRLLPRMASSDDDQVSERSPVRTREGAPRPVLRLVPSDSFRIDAQL